MTDARWRRYGVFVAVVWSTAGAYWVLEQGAVALVSSGGSHWIPGSVVLPRQSRAGLRHCQEVLQSVSPPAPKSALDGQGWYPTWSMGLALGIAAALRNTGTPGPDVSRFLEQARSVAARLAVPPPELPAPGRSLAQDEDFNRALAEDVTCVAASLGFRYSDRHAALYRLGALVGFTNVVAKYAPQSGDVFAPQIRAYATAAQIPERLWRPLMDGAPAEAVTQLEAYLRDGK